MRFARRFCHCGFDRLSLAPARAAELAHACLDQKERRAEIESGRVVRLDTAIAGSPEQNARHRWCGRGSATVTMASSMC